MTDVLGQRQVQEVMAFCKEHDLVEKARFAVEEMTKAFPDARRVSVELECDPDSHHRWLLIDVAVAGKAKEVRVRHDDCADRIVLALGWPACSLIHTTYSLVSSDDGQ